MEKSNGYAARASGTYCCMTNAGDTYTRTETWHLIFASHAISFDAWVSHYVCMRYTRGRNNFQIMEQNEYKRAQDIGGEI